MKQVGCSCGYVASAETAEGLLTAVEAHIAASHGDRYQIDSAPEAAPDRTAEEDPK
jgi:predicted small metal-binding protein